MRNFRRVHERSEMHHFRRRYTFDATRRCMALRLCTLLSLILLLSTTGLSQTPTVREIYVPLDDLNVVLESETQRVFLTRKEYDELLAKAKTTAESLAPIASVVTSASYQATLEPGRAVIEGKITLETLHDGMQLIPLQLSGVGVRSAMLDDKPAILAQDPNLGPVLVVSGRGQHTLTLTLTTPLATSAAQQTLSVQLPHAPAARLSLNVPGNVEVRSGAAVIGREVDAEAKVTQLELELLKGPLNIVLSLNNKLLAKDLVSLARSVFVDEMTQSYERLHATVTLVVLHGALESAAMELPQGFEVTSVVSPLVSRWAVEEGVLNISLREPATESVVLSISAVRNGPPPEDWRFPQLTVKNVQSQAAVIGLLLEDRLQAKSIAASSLVPIDTAVLESSIPASVLEAGPGLPAIRPVVAYYAPHEAFSVAASFDRPEGQLFVTSSVLLTVAEQSQTAEVRLSLVPRAERVFQLEVLMPISWQVTAAQRSDGQELKLERYPAENGVTRLHITIPGGAPVGSPTDIVLQATSVPAGWLDTWQEKTFAFPNFKVVAADRADGAIAIAVSDDLLVRPEKNAGLLPLTDLERNQFQLGRGTAALAYRHDGPLPEATFTAVREQASIVGEIYNFHLLRPGALNSHYELNYEIREATVRELSFSLPVTTPEQVTISGLAGVTVKDTRSEVVDGRRMWKLQLDQRRRGIVKIAVDLEMKLPADLPKGYVLPLAKAEGVQYQTGLVAVEGHAELDVEVAKHPRKVDEGELYAAEYQVGSRLVGAFGYLGAGDVQVNIVRHAAYALPSALSRQTRLVTQIGVGGVSQTEANYYLRTKAAFLEIELPPNSELWTITLDGQPTKPQKNAGRLLLSLPTTAVQQERNVKIVFEQQSAEIFLAGNLRLLSPRLLVRETPDEEAIEVPSADAQWQLILPTGFQARRSFGTVDFERTLPARQPAAWRFIKMVGAWGRVPVLPSVQMAREAGRKSTVLHDDSRSMTKSEAPPPTSSAPLAYDADPFGADDLAIPMDTAPEAAEEPATRDDPKEAMEEMDEVMPAAETASQPQPAIALPANEAAPQNAPKPDEEKAGGKAIEGEGREVRGSNLSKALEGVAGLIIGVQTEGRSPTIQLASLGDSPEAGVLLVRREPMIALAWAVGLAVFGFGMLRIDSTARARVSYVAAVMVAATLIPLAMPSVDALGEALDGAFFGAAFTGIAYVLMALCGTMKHATRAVRNRWVPRIVKLLGLTGMLLMMAMLAAKPASAQQGPGVAPIAIENILPFLIEDPKAVKVPDDAVIVPFDSADPEGIAKAEKVLVPYAKYLELWNLVHPDKKLAGPEPQLAYGVGTAQYDVQLGSDDSLDVRGVIDIELFSDKPVSIPLQLAGGVLLSAKLDGKAARLQIVQGDLGAQQAANVPGQAGGEPIVLLYVSGQGRKKLELNYRIKLERQGGWRVGRGTLPAAGGAALTIKGPNAAAEIRLAGVIDRDAFETTKAGETIETALGPAGSFNLSWRPKVAENMVDRGLAVQSQALFDVRQDVLRLTWQLNFEFPRSRRDRLTLETPEGYTVEKVVGENIRAWEAKQADGLATQLEVTLLKEAVDKESLTVHLAKYGAVGHGEMATIRVPVVIAAGAPLQQGTLTLRRDPLLDVRITSTLGVTREDANLDAALGQAADAYDKSPIDLRTFQAYRFVALPATVSLSIAPQPVKTEAEIQALLNVSERSTSMEARVIVTPHDLPVHRVDIVLPKDLTDEEITSSLPGGFERSIVEKNGRRILSIYARNGQLETFHIVILGKLTRRDDQGVVKTPQLDVLGMARQQGAMVIQADPAYDVTVRPEANCETLPVAATHAWLQDKERINSRAAIRWQSPEYSAQVRLEAKTPVISSRLFHNVRITPRTLEQTVIAEFQIREAGVRVITLLLPEQLRDARVQATNARRTLIESVGENLPEGFVRLRIELEDEFQGIYKVLLSHDRLISAQQQTVQLPVLEAGSPQRRFLSLESAGRDEVIVEGTKELDSLARGQQAFNELVSVLGGDNFVQAYAATSNSAGPALSLSLKERETVETAAARIGLAETLLVVDRSGAYRARQMYRVDNSSEQFLEIALPAGAELWTVTVDGSPVKPVIGAKGGSNVRIPLIRRARGDADYEVALVYAGRVGRLGWTGRVSFPFPQSVNINVERSVVRLMLPENYSHRFDGSLGQPVDEAGALQTKEEYFRRQIGLSLEVLRSSDKFAQARAQNNLKQLGIALQSNYADNGRWYNETNPELTQSFEFNNAEIQRELSKAQEEILQEGVVVEQGDNRGRLNSFFLEQDVQRSKNVVGNDIRNFDEQTNGSPEQTSSGKQHFNKEWLEKNQLAQGQKTGEGKPGASRYVDDAKKTEDRFEAGEGQQRPRFGKGSGMEQTGTEPRKDDRPAQQMAGENYGDALDQNRSQALGRYRDKLSQQTEQQQELYAIPNAGPQTAAGGQAGGMYGMGGLAGPNRQPGFPGGINPPVIVDVPGTDVDAAAIEIQLDDFGERTTARNDLAREMGGFAGPGLAGRGNAPRLPQGQISTSGFASLDIDIPQRGEVYRFVTARGEVEITTQYVDTTWLVRMAWLAGSAIAIAALFFAARAIDWTLFDRRLRWAGPLVLLATGLLLVLLSSYGLWGLMLIVIGGSLLLRAWLLRREAAAA